MPTGAEPDLPGRGGGEPMENNVQNPEREMDTTEGNLRDSRRVNCKDTAMCSKGPDGRVQDSNQGKDKRKPMGEETLETALGEQMYQEAVLEKEKIAKENEFVHAEIQRLRAAAIAQHQLPHLGSRWPPEDDEVFVTPPLPPVPPFPEFEDAHAGGGWGVMWKPVPKATELGRAWPKGYWEVPFHRRPDVRLDPQVVQHRLQAAHQEVNQRHQGEIALPCFPNDTYVDKR
eukprot:s1335_g11.t1